MEQPVTVVEQPPAADEPTSIVVTHVTEFIPRARLQARPDKARIGGIVLRDGSVIAVVNSSRPPLVADLDLLRRGRGPEQVFNTAPIANVRDDSLTVAT